MDEIAITTRQPSSLQGNSEETISLKNGTALTEDNLEKRINGVPCTDQTKNNARPAWYNWFRNNWKWIITCAVSFGIGIVIGLHIRSNKADCSQVNTTEYRNRNTVRNRSVVFDDWVLYNGHRYYFSDDRRNWTSSISYCKEYGAELAVLEREDMKVNVKRFTKHNDEQWCGGYMENGTPKWLEGNGGPKNILGSNCLTWNPDEFLQRDCSEEKHFICIAFTNQR